ncbi:MAG: glycoside hydrolase family 32 protein, partial [Verrucomicrobiota bacterium]
MIPSRDSWANEGLTKKDGRGKCLLLPDYFVTTIMRIVAFLLSLFSASWSFAQDQRLYREHHRPQFHFTPAENWMNDPNGMVFYEGEYHLFYQYNPFGDKWGHMSWGHAVSRDLIHWEHLPLALAEANNVMIFSGSAVIDWNNSSGFGKDDEPPMVAIYTGHHTNIKRQDQRLAYSRDRGRTWTKYENNPVIDLDSADFRDPKVFWHEPTRRWVMIVTLSAERKLRIYGSSNLRDWTHLSDFGPHGCITGVWECPDLFELPVEGTEESKWVIILNIGGGAPAGGSGCQYFIGDFDGQEFTLHEPSQPRPQPAFVPTGTVFADFENDFQGWSVEGEAFGHGPVSGAVDGQQAVTGFTGKGFANSFHGGDESTGRLISPTFEIKEPAISFLIGGGGHKTRTCINLLVDETVVRSAEGRDDEKLDWQSWEVANLKGQQARIEIVDRWSEGWGHINVDQIILSDQPAEAATQPALWADWGRDFYAA